MLDIGLEIKILRERLKVSSKELAEKVGLSQSQMSRLEKGQRRIDTGILHRIAGALGVEPGFFFRQASGETAAGSAAPAPAEPATVPRIRHEHLGKLIRSERRRRHLTVDELATRVGRTKAYMTALEEGRHALDADLADRICRALRLSPNFLLGAQQAAIDVLEKQVARLDQALAEAHRGEPGADPAGRGVPLLGAIGQELELDADDRPIGAPEEFIRLPGLDATRCFALTVSDDAMEGPGAPSFREGDIVVFGPGITRSRDFVLARLTDGGVLFRQIFHEPKGLVRLQPLNLTQAAVTCARGELAAVWKLVTYVARV